MVWTAYKCFVPAYREGALAPRHWERLGYTLYHADFHEEALEVMRKQHGAVTSFWGERYADPVKAFDKAREDVIRMTIKRAHPLAEDFAQSLNWGPEGPASTLRSANH